MTWEQTGFFYVLTDKVIYNRTNHINVWTEKNHHRCDERGKDDISDYCMTEKEKSMC